MRHCRVVVSSLVLILLAKVSVVAQTPAVNSVLEVRDILWSTQERFAGMGPPSEQIYIHPDEAVYSINWKGMPKILKKRMHAKMVGDFPVYELLITTDAITRETVFYNSRDVEVYRFPAVEDDCDPYIWMKTKFNISSHLELDEWHRWIFDYAHTGVSLQMVPVSLYTAFIDELAYQNERAQLLESMSLTPMSMMMSSISTAPELKMDIESQTNGSVEVMVEWLAGLDSDTLDLFHATDLMSANWQLETNFPTAGSTNFFWVDADTGQTGRFYVTGTDYDEDLDSLSSARERYLYKTDESLFSTDADGLGDGWEIGYGFDPFSASGTNGALGDVDNDGYSNLEEQLNNTDPKIADSNSNTGTVATMRYYYDEDDRLTDCFVGADTAQQTILTAAHNIIEEICVN